MPVQTPRIPSMATPPAPPKPEKRRRYDREFRIMFRPTGTSCTTAPVAPSVPGRPQRSKVSRILARAMPPLTLVDDLCSKLTEKSAHWALVVMKAPYDRDAPRVPVTADDSRIERVFEISRVPRNQTAMGEEETGEQGEEDGLMRERAGRGESSSGGQNIKGKEKEKGTRWGTKAKGKAKCAGGRVPQPRYARAPTPDDSSGDDRHEDDEGFPEVNEKGKNLKMQVSEKPRIDFAELQFDHLGGPLWEILTGIEARTKFTNTELKHEATRIWKRQQNYHLLDNNCQRFCILMAITIRAKNHSLLRVLHDKTVKKQIKGMEFGGAKK